MKTKTFVKIEFEMLDRKGFNGTDQELEFEIRKEILNDQLYGDLEELKVSVSTDSVDQDEFFHDMVSRCLGLSDCYKTDRHSIFCPAHTSFFDSPEED